MFNLHLSSAELNLSWFGVSPTRSSTRRWRYERIRAIIFFHELHQSAYMKEFFEVTQLSYYCQMTMTISVREVATVLRYPVTSVLLSPLTASTGIYVHTIIYFQYSLQSAAWQLENRRYKPRSTAYVYNNQYRYQGIHLFIILLSNWRSATIIAC